MSASIYEIPLHTLEGKPATLGEFKGKVVLVVNVASKCGLTPQYEGLEKLYKDYRDRGLVIAAFPSNDFAGQEPGTSEEIATFCSTNYGVDFPIFEKIPVVGPKKHLLYAELIAAKPKAVSTGGTAFVDGLTKYLAQQGTSPNQPPEILWNFEKFLVSKTGEVVERFSPDTDPFNPTLTTAIEAELAE